MDDSFIINRIVSGLCDYLNQSEAEFILFKLLTLDGDIAVKSTLEGIIASFPYYLNTDNITYQKIQEIREKTKDSEIMRLCDIILLKQY